MAWVVNSSVASNSHEEEINVGFSREDERSARANRHSMKKVRKSNYSEWDDEDDGWN